MTGRYQTLNFRLFTYHMKSTVQGVFHIADNHVYPFEFWHLNALRATTVDYRNMLMAALFKSSEAFKAIGNHLALRSQMLLGLVFDRFLGKCAHLAEANGMRMTLVTDGYCCDERVFSGSTSSSLTITLFPAPIGVLDPDIFSIERFAIITLFHNLLDFVLDQQSCVV
jgi:hypothetical protein